MIAREPSQISKLPKIGRMAFWSVPPCGASILYLSSRLEEQIYGGCLPPLMTDGCHLNWVKRLGQFGILQDGATRKEANILILPKKETFNHGCFSSVTPAYEWLARAACPPDQHNHDSSYYEIFVQKFDSKRPEGAPRRLTTNSFTDRNPVVWTPSGAVFASKHRDVFSNGSQTAERLASLFTDNIPGLHGIEVESEDGVPQKDFACLVDFSRNPVDGFTLNRGKRYAVDSIETPEGGGRRLPPASLTLVRCSCVARRVLGRATLFVPSCEQRSLGTIVTLAKEGGAGNFLVRQTGPTIEVFSQRSRGEICGRSRTSCERQTSIRQIHPRCGHLL